MDLSTEVFSSDFNPSLWLTEYIQKTGKSLQQCVPLLQGLSAQLQALYDDEEYALKRATAKFLSAIPGVEQNFLLLKREIDATTQKCPKVEVNLVELCELNDKKKILEKCSTALRELGKWNESLMEIENLIDSQSQFFYTFKKIVRLRDLLDSCLKKLPDYEKRKHRLKVLESTLHSAIKYKIRRIFLDDEVEMFEYVTVLMTNEKNDIIELAGAAFEEEIVRVWRETRSIHLFFDNLIRQKDRYLKLLNLEILPDEWIPNDSSWMNPSNPEEKEKDLSVSVICLQSFECGMHRGLKKFFEEMTSVNLDHDVLRELSKGLTSLVSAYFHSPLHSAWRRIMKNCLPLNLIDLLASKIYKDECDELFEKHIFQIREITRDKVLDYEKNGRYKCYPGIVEIIEKSEIREHKTLVSHLFQYLDRGFVRYFKFWTSLAESLFEKTNRDSNFDPDVLDLCLTTFKATSALEKTFQETTKKALNDFALSLDCSIDKLSCLEISILYNSGDSGETSLPKTAEETCVTIERSLELVVHCCVQPTYEMLATYETDLLNMRGFTDEMVPLNSMTLVVEHIMALIQQADSKETTTWLRPVVGEIYCILLRKIQNMRKLSSRQSKKLVVDVSYLLKLGDALGGTEANPLVKFLENLKSTLARAEVEEIDLTQLVEKS